MSNPSPKARGQRYSPPEKSRIIEYIQEHNRTKGRGGQRAAHRKFGVSTLTLKNWMTYGIHGLRSGPSKLDNVGRILESMHALARRMEEKEEALARLKARYERLKGEI